MTEQLEAFVRASVAGAPPTIGALERPGHGRSRDNWVFDATWPDGRVEHLILRRDPLGGLVDTDRSVEFAVLRALEPAPLTTPRALWLDATGEFLERPALVMVRDPGECDYDLLNGARSLPDRLRLARELCDLMASVHELDWGALGLRAVLPDPGSHPSLHELRHWEAVFLKDRQEQWPEIEQAIAALSADAPACSDVTLVHADFKAGNVLLTEDGEIGTLLDWELAHLGDPLEDLGWVTQPMRFREHRIDGVWGRDEIVAHYEAVRGVQVDASALAWWNLFSVFKTGVMQVSGLRAFREGRSEEHYSPSEKVLRTLVTSLEVGGSLAAPRG